VAAHVQEETTALATRPDLTVRPAVENISEVCFSSLYRFRAQVVKTLACVSSSVEGELANMFVAHHSDGEQSADPKDNSISPGLA
jgi:hypothetical protein